MKKIRILLPALVLFSLALHSQKPPLDHAVYDNWESLSTTIISNDGKWVSYVVNPQQGDGWLYLYNAGKGSLDSAARGTRPVFSALNNYLAFQVIPKYDETREAKKKKLKEDKMPKNSLEIRLLASGEKIIIERVKSFAVPEERSEWMAYLLEKKNEEKKDTSAKEENAKTGRSVEIKTPKKSDPKGTEFVIFNPALKKEYRYSDVTEYSVSKNGRTISFLQDIPDTTKVDLFKVNLFDTQKESSKIIFEGKGTVKKLAVDNSGSSVSFIYTSDTSKVKIYDLWLSKNGEQGKRIVDASNRALPSGWSVSENGSLTFSDDGTRIYFGSARKPVKEPEDTLLDDEKFKLDIWSWDDDFLQPQQKKQLDQELKRAYQAVYHIDKSLVIQLADSALPAVRTISKGNGDWALASSDLKYRKYSSWDTRNYSDQYIINIETGKRKLIMEKDHSVVYLSPDGNFLLIYDYDLQSWFSLPSQGGDRKNLTAKIPFPLYDELNDSPSDPRPYGIAGWLNDQKHVLIYDRFDLWLVDVTGVEVPQNITNSFGRKNNIRLRFMDLDPDEELINGKDIMYLAAFNYDNKESGFYTIKQIKPTDPLKLIMEKAAFSRGLTKAKDAGVLCFQKETFASSPNIFISGMDMKEAKKISELNPQQKNYNWLTAELVEWTSLNNERLQGILYKPGDFDPSKKYPMIVYFYERSSDGLYTYFSPAPSASIINRSFAASNGYLVFVPDIPYRIGYPGQSCYNAVVSGTISLCDRYDFIDRSRLGLDGQSWGGYQIAWLVTQTDMFKCAYAGAPVVNMTSAYGGIRWESGMSRMFQYEQTQSRIGGTLWEKPVHYIENSPIFFAPKINTPLLLMHNDADGAVPWYQGIEFITALRRLEKPSWLLSYNDEAHNLVKRPNRKDISVRKMQFFDHYLKGAAMPYWMKYGIGQTEKGKIDGYQLVND